MDSEQNIVRRALALINANDYVDAEKVLTDGLKEESNNQKMLNLLGWVLFHREKYKEMIAVYKKLVQLNPQQSFTMFYNLGKAYYQLGNYSAAVESFHKTIEIVPDHKSAIFYLCLSHAKSGDLKRAKKVLSTYKDKFSENIESITDISMQDGMEEFTLEEMGEQADQPGKKDKVMHYSIDLFGVWSITRKNVVLWDGSFDVEISDEYINYRGEGRLMLRDRSIVLVLGKQEAMWVNSRHFIGINRKLDSSDMKTIKSENDGGTIMYEFKGPAKVIIQKVPYMTANLFENYCIRSDSLLAILGHVKIAAEKEVIRVTKGGGKAFLL